MQLENALWTEKYRPSDFSEIKGQKEIVKRVKAFVEQQNLPHLLFAGPAGVGKSTLAIVIAKKLFGTYWRNNFLELNASDTRGIDTIRTNVKDFARTKSIGNVPFKIIFLDEADALTREAQQALRRTMENYAQTCRFILSCVTPDTKVLLPNEVELSIKEFIKHYQDAKQIRVYNVSEKENTIKNDLVLACVQLPPHSIGKRVLEITTMTGRKIKATEDHMLLTTNGWKEAGLLNEGDSILVYPSLVGTEYEYNNKKVIDIGKFISFISELEEKAGSKNIKDANMFRELKTRDKEKIIERIYDLKKIVDSGKGLTKKEYLVYDLIRNNNEISRKEIQDKIKLGRIRTVQLLKQIEQKGNIKRIIDGKTHKFIISSASSYSLRNYVDIRNLIQSEFKINISYSAVKKSLDDSILRGKVDRIMGELKRKDILDATYNDLDKVGALARLCGFMHGDGHLVHNGIRLYFSGNKNALENVKKDLDTLSYHNYSKTYSKIIKNIIRGRKFEGTTTWFYLDSTALSALFQFLGVSKGDKTINEFDVPEFTKNGTKFVKREFLRALFGCDADKPSWNGMNFNAVALRQNKSVYLKESMLHYYKGLSSLFKEFGIETYIEIRNKKEVRTKDDVPVLTFGLIIKPNNKNLLKFFSKIGYAYEDYKINLTRLAAEYLRHKCNLINLYRKKSELILARIGSGSSMRKIAKEFDVSLDFVIHQKNQLEVHLPRKKFMNFDDWLRKYTYNGTFLINNIVEIKEINVDEVMDLTCHKDHNFITNGFISHNCNYSSKIIEPIQSRCVVFRFKPLDKKDVIIIIDKIAEQEKIKIDEKAKEALFEISEGDCRRLENVLQSSAAITNHITEDLIHSMASVAKPKELREVLELALNNKFIEARNKLLDLMLNYGLAGIDIIKQIQKEILELNIDNKSKMLLIEKCGEIEFRMTEGSDEFVQLEALLSQFALAGSR